MTVEKDGRAVRVLFDAGITPHGLVDNMRRLEISPGDVDIVVLSHGHWDHTTGMDGFVAALGRASLPVLIHPEFWTGRRLAPLGRDPVELPTTSRGALEGRGSRSSRSGSRRSCSTAPCSSPARSTARPSSSGASRSTRRSAAGAGSPTR